MPFGCHGQKLQPLGPTRAKSSRVKVCSVQVALGNGVVVVLRYMRQVRARLVPHSPFHLGMHALPSDPLRLASCCPPSQAYFCAFCAPVFHEAAWAYCCLLCHAQRASCLGARILFPWRASWFPTSRVRSGAQFIPFGPLRFASCSLLSWARLGVHVP